MTQAGQTLGLRAVLYREDEGWIGQCLEHDVAAQADNLEQLYYRLLLTLQLEQRTLERRGRSLADLPPAPRHFHLLFEKAHGSYVPNGGDGPPPVSMKLAA